MYIHIFQLGTFSQRFDRIFSSVLKTYAQTRLVCSIKKPPPPHFHATNSISGICQSRQLPFKKGYRPYRRRCIDSIQHEGSLSHHTMRTLSGSRNYRSPSCLVPLSPAQSSSGPISTPLLMKPARLSTAAQVEISRSRLCGPSLSPRLESSYILQNPAHSLKRE